MIALVALMLGLLFGPPCGCRIVGRCVDLG
jgi:hypothetical protein